MDLRDLNLGLDMLMNRRKTSVDGMSQASRSPPPSVGAPSIRSVRLSRGGAGRGGAATESISIDPEEDDEEVDEDGSEEEDPRQSFQAGFEGFQRGRASPSERSFATSIEDDPRPLPRRGYGSPIAPPMIPRRTQDDVLNAKRELLYQLERLEKRGVKVPRKFTLASDLDEMQLEYDRLRRDRETDLSIAFQKKVILAGATGLEFLNSRFDPFSIQLDGWSEQLQGEIGDYDEVLEQLAVKYASKAQMAPEIKLLMMLSGSAFTYHLSKTYFRNLPGLEQVLKQNPDLMRQFANAAMSTHAQNATQQGDRGTAHAANMFGTLFGRGEAPPPPPMQHPGAASPAQPRMRGPTNVDDLLSELHMTADAAQPPPSNLGPVPQPQQAMNTGPSLDAVEVLSVGGSDDDSIDGLLQASGRGGFTLNL
jgi:hypothetical protein